MISYFDRHRNRVGSERPQRSLLRVVRVKGSGSPPALIQTPQWVNARAETCSKCGESSDHDRRCALEPVFLCMREFRKKEESKCKLGKWPE